MPRESAASIAILPASALTRVDAPGGLEPAELALFYDVVNSKPADWFGPDSVPLMVEYVRASVMCDLLDGKVKLAIAGGEEGEEPIPLALMGKVIEGFLRLRDMESKRMLNIATKLRLTQQSRYTPQAAATANKNAGTARPWLRQSK